MADKQKTDEEPSIEEILDSIRQIISDDDEGGDSHESGQEDVLELTDRLDEPAMNAPLAPPPEPSPPPVSAPPPPPPPPEPVSPPPAASPAPVSAPAVQEPLSPPPPPPSVQPAAPPAPPASRNQESLMTERAENAVLKGFSDLSKKLAVEHGGITLEDIVRTELNPLLRDWLDRHLPSLIERLVAEELGRISKRAMEE